MTLSRSIVGFAIAVAGAIGCSAGGDAGASVDGSIGVNLTRPTWTLEDVQPESPRAGQVYGLDAFPGKVVVVTLLEGF